MPDEIFEKLKSDTLRIGLDEYALLGVSYDLVPKNILRYEFDRIHNGDVVLYDVFMKKIGKEWSIHWERIN